MSANKATMHLPSKLNSMKNRMTVMKIKADKDLEAMISGKVNTKKATNKAEQAIQYFIKYSDSNILSKQKEQNPLIKNVFREIVDEIPGKNYALIKAIYSKFDEDGG